ncbi:MAG: OmpH family outer membrane protein, partial [Paraprevotella sp.]|nr:OmpH family outer membrane protein [Paraprevotella sp.]
MKGLKKMVGALLLLVLATAVRAQETQSIKFGFLSYNEIFQTMPEFADAQKKMAELKAKYDQ